MISNFTEDNTFNLGNFHDKLMQITLRIHLSSEIFMTNACKSHNNKTRKFRNKFRLAKVDVQTAMIGLLH
jgi:hypothetical protein